MGPSDEDKIKNAETMYGTGSKQHEKAKKLFGGSKPDGSNSRGGMSKTWFKKDDEGKFNGSEPGPRS